MATTNRASEAAPAVRTRPEDPAPAAHNLVELRAAALSCQACPLYKHATQTVFGAGPAQARVMLVGEQPGNDEDLAGQPFVGPAGRLLDKLLEDAGVERGALYLTNAVKHFKFVSQGKRRLHQKPKGLEVKACKPWLLAEIDRVRPEVLVAMGATAAAALFGSAVSVIRDRGRPVASPLAPHCFVTYHPSAALRGITPEDRARVRQALLEDLQTALATGPTPDRMAPPPTLRPGHVGTPGSLEFAPSPGKTRQK